MSPASLASVNEVTHHARAVDDAALVAKES
jgi:hypothetical protein